MKERLLFYIIGMLILTFGVAFIIKSNAGAAPWDALAVGQSKLLPLSVGTFVFINGSFLILVNSFLLKKKPELLAVITILVIGILIDFWLHMVLESFSPDKIEIQASSLLLGILILGLGIAIYLQAKFPASPMDTLMVAIHERFGISIQISRIISEGFALLLAVFVQGPIGVGSIVVTLSLGPIVQFFYPKFAFFLFKIQSPKKPVL